MKAQGRIGKPRRLQHAPPQQADGAELGKCGEHVLVRRQGDADRPHEVHVVEVLERAQRGHGGCQRGAQLLCLGGALLVPAAAIGLHVGAGVAAPGELRRIGRIGERERDVEALGVDGLRGDQFGQRHGGAALDAQRHGMEVHALQHARQPRGIDSISARRGPVLRHQHQAGGAIGKVVERQFIGARRVRVVDALMKGPRHLGGPRRAGAGQLAVKRFEPDPVGRRMDQLFLEGGALQHRLDALHPVVPAKRRKLGGQL